MSNVQASGASDFFRAQSSAFSRIVSLGRKDARMIEVLTARAFDSFERNAAIQFDGEAPAACGKGCETCCCLRVVATAPEIFMVERFIRVTAQAFAAHSVDLAQKVADVEKANASADERARMDARRLCPFIIGGACAIYSVRPLACRGHISFDREACIAAAAGAEVDVPTSAAHATVRALVQNALQAALFENALGWGVYELTTALNRALQDASCEARWRAGDDVFSDLNLAAAEGAEMAAVFDSLIDHRV